MALVQEITLLLIMVSGLLGNGLIIRVICGDVLMQTMGNKFAFSMAVSDLGLCVFFMPFSLISLFRYEWMFGQNMCNVTAFFGEFFTRVSTVTLSVVVLEKHSNIVQRKVKNFSRNGVFVTFFVLWMTGLVFSVPYPPLEAVYDTCLGNCIIITSHAAPLKSKLIFVLLEGLLFKLVPASLLVVSLLKVFKKVHVRRCMMLPGKKHGPMLNVAQLQMMAKDYTACTTLIVVASHVLLYLPYFIIQLIRIWSNTVVPHSWRIVTFWLVLFNAALRPLIYGLRNRRSRNLMLQYYKRAKRNLITQNWFMKLGRRRRAYVVPVTARQQTEQTKIQELQIVDVIDIAPSATPLFTRRRIMTVRTINTATEQPFLDLNCAPDEEIQMKLQPIPQDCCEMTSLGRRMENRNNYDLCIQDIETEDTAAYS